MVCKVHAAELGSHHGRRVLSGASPCLLLSYGVEIKPEVVETIQRPPHRTTESMRPTPGTVSPRITLRTPFGPCRIIASPRTSRTIQPSMVIGRVSGTGWRTASRSIVPDRERLPACLRVRFDCIRECRDGLSSGWYSDGSVWCNYSRSRILRRAQDRRYCPCCRAAGKHGGLGNRTFGLPHGDGGTDLLAPGSILDEVLMRCQSPTKSYDQCYHDRTQDNPGFSPATIIQPAGR
jgi:hypothetical protein